LSRLPVPPPPHDRKEEKTSLSTATTPLPCPHLPADCSVHSPIIFVFLFFSSVASDDLGDLGCSSVAFPGSSASPRFSVRKSAPPFFLPAPSPFFSLLFALLARSLLNRSLVPILLNQVSVCATSVHAMRIHALLASRTTHMSSFTGMNQIWKVEVPLPSASLLRLLACSYRTRCLLRLCHASRCYFPAPSVAASMEARPAPSSGLLPPPHVAVSSDLFSYRFCA
jgi:hypothetical protein